MAENATLNALRENGTANAIVFVHGFSGDPSGTWGKFPQFLTENQALNDWDVYSLGYASGLAPDFKGMWTGNPSVTSIASQIYTRAYVGELERYGALVFIAHSMGGLAVQRALLDYPSLLERTSHVFLFGTPSNGLKKAGWFKWFKRQVDDMNSDGEFIRKLRKDWDTTWPEQPSFKFWSVAGDNDEFVPTESSIGPFMKFTSLKERLLLASGNHLDMVKPKTSDSLAVKIVTKGIQGDAAPAGPWNSARVALQMLDFRKAVDTLKPHADELDDAHLVVLALALNGLGHIDKALTVLRRSIHLGTDARGVLAGRLKRMWIASGRKADYEQALKLYSSAYEEAVSYNDHSQALYHGINICFLMVAGSDKNADIAGMANKVLEHCNLAPQDIWSLGTKGEAKLCLGDKEGALASYRDSVSTSPEPWQLQSMHSQACQLAALLDFDDLTDELNQIFRQDSITE